MSGPVKGRLSTLQAALVVARRDFAAVLLSRAFVFFLLGPLFMLGVTIMATGVGQSVERSVSRPVLGVALPRADAAALEEAQRLMESLPG